MRLFNYLILSSYVLSWRSWRFNPLPLPRPAFAVGGQGGGEADGAGQLQGRGGDAVHVEADLGQLLVALGVHDEPVGQAEASDVGRRQAGVAGGLEHGR